MLKAVLGIFLLVATVDGVSMQPALNPGDKLLILRRWPVRWLRKGQIVVFTPCIGQAAKHNAKKGRKSVKRIIALPGDTAVGYTKAPLEIYPMELRITAQDVDDKRLWKIPSGYFFVQGDHPDSADSKQFGPLPFECLIGIVILRLPNARKYSSLYPHS